MNAPDSGEFSRLPADAEGNPEFGEDENPGLGRGDHPTAEEHPGQRRLAVLGLGALMLVAILVGAMMLWITGEASG